MAGYNKEEHEQILRQTIEKRKQDAEAARIQKELREAQERADAEHRARLKAEAEARMLLEEMERRAKEEEKREREEKLKSMTPVQRMLYEFDSEIDELHKHDSHCLYRDEEAELEEWEAEAKKRGKR